MNASTYAAITPVRDEAENLARLAASLLEQSVLPVEWLIVDNGSVDGTVEQAQLLARTHEWIRVMTAEAADRARPGAPVVRAFNTGLAELREPHPDVIVKLDADVSMESDYFERILGAFSADERLGIAGGACLELRDGEWQETFVTGDHVRGASRCYRRECLEDVSPLEERVGWDGVDELKAAVRGWRTRLLRDVPFHHHRRVGARDGSSTTRWNRLGQGSYFMGYRFSYLLLRSLHHALRHPAALAMISGYLRAALRRERKIDDKAVRDYLREQQRLRRVPLRFREAVGRRG